MIGPDGGLRGNEDFAGGVVVTGGCWRCTPIFCAVALIVSSLFYLIDAMSGHMWPLVPATALGVVELVRAPKVVSRIAERTDTIAWGHWGYCRGVVENLEIANLRDHVYQERQCLPYAEDNKKDILAAGVMLYMNGLFSLVLGVIRCHGAIRRNKVKMPWVVASCIGLFFAFMSFIIAWAKFGKFTTDFETLASSLSGSFPGSESSHIPSMGMFLVNIALVLHLVVVVLSIYMIKRERQGERERKYEKKYGKFRDAHTLYGQGNEQYNMDQHNHAQVAPPASWGNMGCTPQPATCPQAAPPQQYNVQMQPPVMQTQQAPPMQFTDNNRFSTAAMPALGSIQPGYQDTSYHAPTSTAYNAQPQNYAQSAGPYAAASWGHAQQGNMQQPTNWPVQGNTQHQTHWPASGGFHAGPTYGDGASAKE